MRAARLQELEEMAARLLALARKSTRGRTHVLRTEFFLFDRDGLHRQNIQRRQARRSSGCTADQIRAGRQFNVELGNAAINLADYIFRERPEVHVQRHQHYDVPFPVGPTSGPGTGWIASTAERIDAWHLRHKLREPTNQAASVAASFTPDRILRSRPSDADCLVSPIQQRTHWVFCRTWLQYPPISRLV